VHPKWGVVPALGGGGHWDANDKPEEGGLKYRGNHPQETKAKRRAGCVQRRRKKYYEKGTENRRTKKSWRRLARRKNPLVGQSNWTKLSPR